MPGQSVLSDAPFKHHKLEYEHATGNMTTDSRGNPIPEVVTRSLTALLAPYKATQLERMPGADANMMRVRGELLTPLEFPSGTKVGSALEFEWAGMPYTLTLTTIIPNDLEGVDFGAYFEGEVIPK